MGSQALRQWIGALALAALSALACAGDADPAIAELDWLPGEWQRTDLPADETGFERWQRAGDGSLAGIGVHERPGGKRFEEKLRIAHRDGVLVYIADTPQNPAPVAFELAHAEEDGLVFENPAHDFPKRITYRRTGTDAMTVRIDGDGKAIDFAFHRAD
jgi:hypothetical protein